MILAILHLLSGIWTALRLRSELALENLDLRQQLAVLHRQHRRPRIHNSDRVFWLLLSRFWGNWKETLVIVRPETVLPWHRKPFASYWTRLSRRNRPGRPAQDRRRIVHFNVTEHPTAEWTSHQIVEAFYDGKLQRFLIRDRDGVYGLTFRERLKAHGLDEVVIALHSPWQTPYVERAIGTQRRECLDHASYLARHTCVES